jgi:hypothetical protein
MVLLGCGGGGGGSTNSVPVAAVVPTTLSGTVATGKPLSSATIVITDTAGRSKSITGGLDGSYTMDISDLVAPLVLKAAGVQSGHTVKMVSVLDSFSASQANVANITPLTTALAAHLSSTGLPDDLSPITDRDRITNGLAIADVALQDTIAPMMRAIGVTGSPIHAPFTANGTGYDKLYDNIVVGLSRGKLLVIGPAAFHDGTNVNNCPAGGSYAGCAPLFSDAVAPAGDNSNICGWAISTIAESGHGIPCDPSRPVVEQPGSPIGVNGGISLGGAGISTGPADTPPPPNPSSTGTWYAHFTINVCVAGQCFSQSTTQGNSAYDAQASCLEGGRQLAAAFNGAALSGVTYSYICNQTP